MKCIGALLVGVALLGSSLAQAEWQLDPEQSQLNFVSVKKDSIGEVHRFTGMTGTVSENGTAELLIDLSSVDTGIAIRDQRMKDELFQTKKFPSAKVTLAFDKEHLAALEEGKSEAWLVDYQVALHGKVVPAKAALKVTRIADNQLLVSPAEPILINAADFDLTGGVDKLKALAALPNIAFAVPVTFSLTFVQSE